MIVFVLGAGASKDYGFPTARKLIFDITDSPVLLNSQKYPKKILIDLNIYDEEFTEFRKRLRNSSAQSVDIFLENNENFVDLGKCLIASQLISCEIKDQLMRINESDYRWYEYMFNRIGTTFKEFSENYHNYAFITFNYDRSLEYYLYYQLNLAFNLPPNTCVAYIQSMKIFHVYGSLGEPLFLSNNGKDYLPELTTEIIRKAASNIEILKSDTKETNRLKNAQEIIGFANRIVFLGFSYGKNNVSRLMPSFRSLLNIPQVIGTGFGLKPAEIIEAKELFDSKLQINIHDMKIMDLLRTEPIFTK